MRNLFSVCFLLAMISFSCSTKKKAKLDLFNVDSLIHAQAHYLNENRARLKKVSILGSSSDSVSITPSDTTAWKNELEVFNVLHLINKPINRNSYTIENQPDTKSNLSVRTFAINANVPADEKKLPIEYLKIYYQGNLEKIRRIEGQYREAGMMYSTRQILSMEFRPVHNKMILASYSIAGGQKMFMGDSVQYKINTSVILTK